MKPIRHAVWGTGAPPVCPNLWAQEDWDRFEDGFRPEGYTGDRYDTEAWEAFRRAIHEQNLKEFLARHGVTS